MDNENLSSLRFMTDNTNTLNSFLKERRKIERELKQTHDVSKRDALTTALYQYDFKIERLILESDLKLKGPTEAICQKISDLDVREIFNRELEKKQNEYDLSSDFIISKLTGEKIYLRGLKFSDRIELIYKHTGEHISVEDPQLLNVQKNYADIFKRSLNSIYNVVDMKKKYGDDWKEKVMELYNQGFQNATEHQIKSIEDKVDLEEKNRNNQRSKDSYLLEENNILRRENNILQQENIQLRKENIELKRELIEQQRKVESITKEYKNNMEELRKGIISVSQMQQSPSQFNISTESVDLDSESKKR